MADATRDEVPPPYRIKRLADELGVSEQTVRSALKAKQIAGVQLGRLWLIPHAEAMRLKGA
jgi:excisionase family DNA binding protein